MAVIKSGATTDQWTIDPTSKAGRVTLYDTTGAVISPASTSPTGSAVPANALFIGGTDGTNLRGIATDASGQVKVLVQNTPAVTVSGTVAVTQSTTPWTVQGDSASGAANAGNPVKIGGAFNTTQPTVTNGQTVDAQMTARGAQIVSTGVDTFNVTVNAALPAGSNVIGHVITDSGSTTVVTGTVTVSGTVTANQGTAGTNANGWPVKLTDGTNVLGTVANPLETSTQSESATGAAVPAEATYIGGNKSGNLVGALIDASGNLQVAVENTVTVSGTVAVTQSTSPWVVSLASTTITGTVAVTQGTSPWVVSSQGTTAAISLTAVGQTQSINMLNLVNAAVVVTSLGVGGTLATEVSIDNGVTWQVVDVWAEALESYVNTATGITATGSYWFEPIGAIWFARVRVLTLTSGTITGTLIGSIAPNLNLEYTGVAGSILPNNLAAVGGNSALTGFIQPLTLDPSNNLRVASGLITPAIVQAGKAVTANTSTVLANAFTSNNTLGNSIVVIVGVGNTTAPTSITDTLNTPNGNPYKLIASFPSAAATFATYIYLLTGCLAGANTVTVNTASATVSSIIYEVSGIIASSNAITANAATSGTIAAPLTFPISPGDISFQAMAVGTASQTITAGSGWTITQINSAGGAAGLFTLGAQYQTNIPMDGVLPIATLTSEPWATTAVTFRAVPTFVPKALDSTSALYVNTEGRKATFRSGQTAITSVAGVGIAMAGSSTKTVRVTRLIISASSTSTTAAMHDLKLFRYQTLTAGVAVGDSFTRLDPFDPATTVPATVLGVGGTPATGFGPAHYTTAPTTATVNTNNTAPFAAEKIAGLSTTPTTTNARFEWDFGDKPGAKGLVLRGTSDFIGVLFDAATLLYDYWIEWTEE